MQDYNLINEYNFSSVLPAELTNSFIFDCDKYDLFLRNLSLNKYSFYEEWLDSERESTSDKFFRKGIGLDWKWGLSFPFFSLLERYVSSLHKPIIIGLSGLPGSGKSTLGFWIDKLSIDLNLEIKVISLDDFYLPAIEMDKAMKGNPWNVPRGIPGSHSVDLLNNTLDSYIRTGKLNCPRFDKSLRNGLGDRSGWIESYPRVLIVEGWFVGCEPLQDKADVNIAGQKVITPSLNQFECDYRELIQDRLRAYTTVWQMFYKTWHLKASNIENTINWKTQQENEMLQLKGSALTGDKLSDFIRMIQTSIPVESLSNINADTIISVNKNRRIYNLFSKKYNFSI